MNWTRNLLVALKWSLYLGTFYKTIPFIGSVSKSLIESYISSSVSFNLDTIYLNWNTSFPAITVCELYNSEKIWDVSDAHFGQEHDFHIDDFISEIAFFRGLCISCDNCHELHCPDNFTLLLDVFRSKCNELIIKCRYLNTLFDCCDQFLPILTEYGVCYSFNSHQATKVAQVQYKNNRITGAGHLKFHATADVQVNVHAPIDVPFQFSEGMIRESVLLGNNKELILNVIEVYNHENVEELSNEQRRCRFSHEHVEQRIGIYEFYSYSGCIVECTVALHLLYCNCTSHFMAVPSQNSLPVCDFRGLICLTHIHEKLMAERKSCDCMSSCEEPEYNIIYNTPDDSQKVDKDISDIHVALVELPTQRYVRRVAKTPLDLLISFGGLISLFFNVSALRTVETIFIFLEYRKKIFNWANRFYIGTLKYLQILIQLK
ncbi:sodium channel protein Nach [Drosophila grimshawi]|uniref:GH19633 n=1 Tax=Drosophila grimshawi TaxID=7222 RepID=B4JRR8_DROGR|nr:sodium channel protein Nach [Drosophila grimshawi]EDV94458.1 GH19633 [Drosophila grimshawi]